MNKILLILMMSLISITFVSAIDICDDVPFICKLTRDQLVEREGYSENDAEFIYEEKCFQYRKCSIKLGTNKPDPKPETIKMTTTSKTSKTSKTSSRFVTRWIWDNNECKKADVLTIPYISNKNSITNKPHIVHKTFNDGSRLVSQILDGNKGIVIDMKTRKYIKNPTCQDKDLFQVANVFRDGSIYLDWNWFMNPIFKQLNYGGQK